MKDKAKRLRLMGFSFFTIALAGCGYGFFVESNPVSITGLFMLSGLFLIMGLLCQAVSWRLTKS